MKKIPTLFKRVFDENHKKTITKEVTPGCEVVLEGESGGSIATVKYDGACCAIIDGEIYRRYDAKQKYNKKPPEGAIPCQPEPDPITGHWPHWVKCVEGNPQDKYFIISFYDYADSMRKRGGYCGQLVLPPKDGTYEAIGPHWQSNPYHLAKDILVRHGVDVIPIRDISNDKGEITFESIKNFLSAHQIEGIVFWNRGQPLCKIKRSDFGFEWPIKKWNE